MQPSELSRAVAAAKSIAAGVGLTADDAVVLHNSNKLALRLTPCDAFARVAPEAGQIAQFEVELAQRLAAAGAPTAALDPRVSPRPHARSGFVVTFWTYYPPAADPLAPAAYAEALWRLHAGMRQIDLATPHFTDRVAEAQELVANVELTPALARGDRAFLARALEDLRRRVAGAGAAEQLLHGEPHPGNLLATKDGPLFIDLETCCRGPVEFDLAHAPEAVAAHYPDADPTLLDACRGLILAMVAAWRWDAGDQFPDGPNAGRKLMNALARGSPWPSLDAAMRAA